MKTDPRPGDKYEQAGRIWTVEAVFVSLVDGRQRVILNSPQQPRRCVLMATLAFAYRPVRCRFVTTRAVRTKRGTSLTCLPDRRSV